MRLLLQKRIAFSWMHVIYIGSIVSQTINCGVLAFTIVLQSIIYHYHNANLKCHHYLSGVQNMFDFVVLSVEDKAL